MSPLARTSVFISRSTSCNAASSRSTTFSNAKTSFLIFSASAGLSFSRASRISSRVVLSSRSSIPINLSTPPTRKSIFLFISSSALITLSADACFTCAMARATFACCSSGSADMTSAASSWLKYVMIRETISGGSCWIKYTRFCIFAFLIKEKGLNILTSPFFSSENDAPLPPSIILASAAIEASAPADIGPP